MSRRRPRIGARRRWRTPPLETAKNVMQSPKRRFSISRFATLALGGMVLLVIGWTQIAQWLTLPSSAISAWALEWFCGGWVQRTELESGRALVVETSVQVANAQTGWRKADAIIEIDPARYGYGLPIFVALLLAAWGPGRLARLLIGYAALLPVQAFCVFAQVLMQIALAADLSLPALAINRCQLNTVVYCYQLSSLVLPSLAPVLLWLLLDRNFVRQTLTPLWQAQMQGQKHPSQEQHAAALISSGSSAALPPKMPKEKMGPY